jgi:hypothetical protein
VGVGDSLEAAFTLAGPVRAGSWHLVGDGIVLEPADLTYDVLWRHDGTDLTLAEVRHHFEPLTGTSQFDATPFETDAPGVAAAARAGDLLVLRFQAAGTASGSVFIPNGDGDHAHGRIPSLTLPR